MGYAVIYALMNLGAFFSGLVSSNTRHLFENVFPPNGLTAVFWVYVFLTFSALILFLIILTRKTDEKAVTRVAEETAQMADTKQEGTQDSQSPAEQKEKVKINNLPFLLYFFLALVFLAYLIWRLASKGEHLADNLILLTFLVLAAVGATWEFLRKRPDHPFRDVRFVFFIFALIPVQTLFAHNWLTIPYYLDRSFAGTFVGEYFEIFSNLNPILIFVLAPLIAGLTTRANVYRMMIWGTLVMASPTFLLAGGPNTWLFLGYILFMTIGEAMWQPRFLQWIAEVAPEGRTGAYMGIGQFPWFLTKLLTATYSGYFVAHYIPKPGEGVQPRTGEMWFYYALIAMVSPILLIIARKWMMKGMKEKASG
ncbi:MAG: hypothetical protein Kow0042_11250 [Calditrichia bacterium]